MVSLQYIDTIKYEAGYPKAVFLLADMDILKSKKVAVFGNGLQAYFVNMYLENQGIRVECFINNDPEMSKKLFCGKRIVTLNKIEKEEYYIIIAMTKNFYNNEVLWQLKLHDYRNFGVAFIEIYHAFGEDKSLTDLQQIVLDETNKILCGEKEIQDIIKPVVNVGQSGNPFGVISEFCWTVTWSNCLLKWLYEEYKAADREVEMLEIGPGKGLFSAVLHQINPNIKIQWLMFELHEQSETAVKAGEKYKFYPADQFECYYGKLEDPNYCIDKKFDIIVMTEVMEHFINNPVPTMKKVAGMLKENGRLYLSTPDGRKRRIHIYNDYKEIPEYTTLEKYEEGHIGHNYEYYKQELEEILEQSGLMVENYDLSDSRNHNFVARPSNIVSH